MILYSERKKFLEALVVPMTTIREACKKAGIASATLYRTMKKDPEFDKQVRRVKTKSSKPMTRIVVSLIEKARSGHLPSIRYLLDQTYGKPQKQNQIYICKKCGDHISKDEQKLYLEFKKLREIHAERTVDQWFKEWDKEGM